jgi:hypothetical protein
MTRWSIAARRLLITGIAMSIGNSHAFAASYCEDLQTAGITGKTVAVHFANERQDKFVRIDHAPCRGQTPCGTCRLGV